MEENGDLSRFPIHLIPLNLEAIREEAEAKIIPAPTLQDALDDNACGRDGWHSEHCATRMAELGESCLLIQAELAQKRLRNLSIVNVLKDCARTPSIANQLRTLEGMAQEACIYNSK